MRRRRRCSIATLAALILSPGVAAGRADAGAAAVGQAPKGSQTVAQRKIDSRLLQEIERARRGAGKSPRDVASGIELDSKGRVLVEIRCDITPAIQKELRTLNASVVSSLPDYRSILAWVPLARLEELARSDEVYAIQPAPRRNDESR